jgi:hypothetical protein
MVAIFGFTGAASVDCHLLADCWRCVTAEEMRRVEEDRRERTQLRAAEEQDNDMVMDMRWLWNSHFSMSVSSLSEHFEMPGG